MASEKSVYNPPDNKRRFSLCSKFRDLLPSRQVCFLVNYSALRVERVISQSAEAFLPCDLVSEYGENVTISPLGAFCSLDKSKELLGLTSSNFVTDTLEPRPIHNFLLNIDDTGRVVLPEIANANKPIYISFRPETGIMAIAEIVSRSVESIAAE